MSKKESESRKNGANNTTNSSSSKNGKATIDGKVRSNGNKDKQKASSNNKSKHGNANKRKGAGTKKKKKMNKVLKIILITLITMLITFTSIFGVYLFRNGGNVSAAIKNIFKDVVGDQDPIFVLIMGVSEDISAELTDTIMLVGYNPDTNKAFVLSIPRDTFIGNNEARAGGYDKINALYQKSPNKTVEAVEKLTGIDINYYVTVKTSVLIDIVDTLGGIEFDVPINMDYDDPSQNLHIHLKAGKQHIDGNKAEQLVRFRHNNNGSTYSASYGDNDEGRTRTQREFVKVVMEKVISTRDIDKIKNITQDVFDNLETDITLNKVFGYIPYAMDFNTNNLQMEQLPGSSELINSLWFFKADTKKTKELINSYIENLGLTQEEKRIYLKEQSINKTNTTNNNKTTSSGKKSTKKSNTSNGKSKTTTKNSTTTTNNTKTKNGTTTTNTTTTKKGNTTNINNTPTEEGNEYTNTALKNETMGIPTQNTTNTSNDDTEKNKNQSNDTQSAIDSNKNKSDITNSKSESNPLEQKDIPENLFRN